MKKFIFSALFLCGSLFLFSTSANAQERIAGRIVKGTGKVAVVVVGSAVKGAWVTTKFVVADVAAPVAKTVFLKAAPKVGKFALKKSAKYIVPTVLKLSLL